MAVRRNQEIRKFWYPLHLKMEDHTYHLTNPITTSYQTVSCISQIRSSNSSTEQAGDNMPFPIFLVHQTPHVTEGDAHTEDTKPHTYICKNLPSSTTDPVISQTNNSSAYHASYILPNDEVHDSLTDSASETLSDGAYIPHTENKEDIETKANDPKSYCSLCGDPYTKTDAFQKHSIDSKCLSPYTAKEVFPHLKPTDTHICDKCLVLLRIKTVSWAESDGMPGVVRRRWDGPRTPSSDSRQEIATKVHSAFRHSDLHDQKDDVFSGQSSVKCHPRPTDHAEVKMEVGSFSGSQQMAQTPNVSVISHNDGLKLDEVQAAGWDTMDTIDDTVSADKLAVISENEVAIKKEATPDDPKSLCALCGHPYTKVKLTGKYQKYSIRRECSSPHTAKKVFPNMAETDKFMCARCFRQLKMKTVPFKPWGGAMKRRWNGPHTPSPPREEAVSRPRTPSPSREKKPFCACQSGDHWRLTLCKYLYRGQYGDALKVLCGKRPCAKKYIVQYAADLMQDELKALTSKTKHAKHPTIPVLEGNVTASRIRDFNWSTVVKQAQKAIPVTSQLLDAALSLTRFNKWKKFTHKRRAERQGAQDIKQGLITSLILHTLARTKFHFFQELNGIFLYTQKTPQKCLKSLCQMGLSTDGKIIRDRLSQMIEKSEAEKTAVRERKLKAKHSQYIDDSGAIRRHSQRLLLRFDEQDAEIASQIADDDDNFMPLHSNDNAPDMEEDFNDDAQTIAAADEQPNAQVTQLGQECETTGMEARCSETKNNTDSRKNLSQSHTGLGSNHSQHKRRPNRHSNQPDSGQSSSESDSESDSDSDPSSSHYDSNESSSGSDSGQSAPRKPNPDSGQSPIIRKPNPKFNPTSDQSPSDSDSDQLPPRNIPETVSNLDFGPSTSKNKRHHPYSIQSSPRIRRPNPRFDQSPPRKKPAPDRSKSKQSDSTKKNSVKKKEK